MIRSLSPRDKVNNAENSDNPEKNLEDDIMVALQDYPPSEVTEPIFRMGEKLRIIKHELYWWRVRSLKTGTVNYIPDNIVARVYHGWLFEGVERHKAEELLLLPVNGVGSFLVRDSSTERGVYSLSVKHRIVKHYRIFRLDNSWYYISPRLTFQCLEDMINHYSDSADGLCCVLTSPCLSGSPVASSASTAPPVVMRHNFDWRRVDRRQLVSTDNCNENTVSYGVRNSIAAYLSFSGNQNSTDSRTDRKKKSKSVYALKNTDYMEDF